MIGDVFYDPGYQWHGLFGTELERDLERIVLPMFSNTRRGTLGRRTQELMRAYPEGGATPEAEASARASRESFDRDRLSRENTGLDSILGREIGVGQHAVENLLATIPWTMGPANLYRWARDSRPIPEEQRTEGGPQRTRENELIAGILGTGALMAPGIARSFARSGIDDVSDTAGNPLPWTRPFYDYNYGRPQPEWTPPRQIEAPRPRISRSTPANAELSRSSTPAPSAPAAPAADNSSLPSFTDYMNAARNRVNDIQLRSVTHQDWNPSIRPPSAVSELATRSYPPVVVSDGPLAGQPLAHLLASMGRVDTGGELYNAGSFTPSPGFSASRVPEGAFDDYVLPRGDFTFNPFSGIFSLPAVERTMRHEAGHGLSIGAIPWDIMRREGAEGLDRFTDFAQYTKTAPLYNYYFTNALRGDIDPSAAQKYLDAYNTTGRFNAPIPLEAMSEPLRRSVFGRISSSGNADEDAEIRGLGLEGRTQDLLKVLSQRPLWEQRGQANFDYARSPVEMAAEAFKVYSGATGQERAAYNLLPEWWKQALDSPYIRNRIVFEPFGEP
ncbi:MAG: hypothetical protein HC883_00600 [Bdellovibrionaceae bacterium]|nr:hypothetical protein [Pseudobdellovibrionaceae bacterium]